MLSRRKCINLDITSTCTLQCPDCQREVYRQQGLKVPGHDMSIEEFKVIFWWEWVHRFLGRLIGISFILPLLFFSLKLHRIYQYQLF